MPLPAMYRKYHADRCSGAYDLFERSAFRISTEHRVRALMRRCRVSYGTNKWFYRTQFVGTLPDGSACWWADGMNKKWQQEQAAQVFG
jgi:hypothetical protein